jgi:hypothetical protein
MRELCLSCVYKSLMAVGLVQTKNSRSAFWTREGELREERRVRDSGYPNGRSLLWMSENSGRGCSGFGTHGPAKKAVVAPEAEEGANENDSHKDEFE